MTDPASDCRLRQCPVTLGWYQPSEVRYMDDQPWTDCPLDQLLPHHDGIAWHPDPRSFPPSWQARVETRRPRRRRSWRIRP